MIPNKIYTDGKSTYATLPVFSNADSNIIYIRKDALLDKLNLALKLRGGDNPNSNTDGVQTIRAMINYIESL